MPRLKSREHFPPGRFQMILSETGQEKPFSGSFNAVCQKTLEAIRGNPFLANKHGWPTTFAGVENMVEAYNVQRCLSGGWYDWLILDQPVPDAASYASTVQTQKKTLLGSAVAGVSRVKAGIGVLLDWLGDGAQPVATELATVRAGVCAACPKNGNGDYTSRFTKPVAAKIRHQLEMRGEMRLSTPHDAKLGVCDACSCPLQLKIFAPLKHILAHTDEEVRKELDPRCSILNEKN